MYKFILGAVLAVSAVFMTGCGDSRNTMVKPVQMQDAQTLCSTHEGVDFITVNYRLPLNTRERYVLKVWCKNKTYLEKEYSDG